MEHEAARDDGAYWYGHALLGEHNVTYGIQVAPTLLLTRQDLGYMPRGLMSSTA